MYGMMAALVYEMEKAGLLKRVSVVSVMDKPSIVIVTGGIRNAPKPTVQDTTGQTTCPMFGEL